MRGFSDSFLLSDPVRQKNQVYKKYCVLKLLNFPGSTQPNVPSLTQNPNLDWRIQLSFGVR